MAYAFNPNAYNSMRAVDMSSVFFSAMSFNVVNIPSASSSEHLQALEEVSDFLTTDMGRGGRERWTYRILREPFLSRELARMSNAWSNRYVDSVSFQPCPLYHSRSQDRCLVEEWNMPGGVWLFNAVLDGHVDHDTVDHISQHLPSMIRQALWHAITNSPYKLPPEMVSKLLSDAIVNLDNSITSNFVSLFPRDLGRLRNMTDSQIKRILLSGSSGEANSAKATRCIQGSTVLVSLTDPRKRNLWVASLGDCQAVLGSRSPSGNWTGTLINNVHNGGNPAELHRIRAQHPGERDCVKDNRVLGFLAPTRAIGDTWLKLPAIYMHRVFLGLDSSWMSPQRAQLFATRLHTPPYVSNIPDTFHFALSASDSMRSFLILYSDGLTDLYDGMRPQDIANHVASVASQAVDGVGNSFSRRSNVALRLLRDALGGEDTSNVSRNLTVEMDSRWMDDTTIVVQQFQ